MRQGVPAAEGVLSGTEFLGQDLLLTTGADKEQAAAKKK